MFKKVREFVPPFIKASIKLFLLQFTILFFCRLLFYFAFKPDSVSQLPGSEPLNAFIRGFAFDMVASTYAMLLPTFLLFLNDFFGRKIRVFYKIALVSVLFIFWLYAFISAADFPYFNQFGSHLNRQAFLWAASPGFVLGLIFGSFSYYGYIFLFLLFAIVIFRVVKKIFGTYAQELSQTPYKPVKILVAFVLLLPFVIAGARGRLAAKSTLHEGLAIVSDHLFVNQVALNPNFTMFRSLLFQKIKKYQVPADIDKSIAYARDHFGIKGPYERSIAREQKSDSVFKPYNVVIVCMESMSSYKTGVQGRKSLTPYFNNIIKESVYFDRFFSSGIHTFNGLFSTCAGYPSMLTEHGLRRYTRQPFTTLGNLLEKKNYETYFYSTHDPHFDNMQGFFTLNGYKKIFSAFDLPKEKSISVTGVPDHETFDLFLKTVNSGDRKRPFLAFIMTGSDHGPWAVPADIPFKPDAPTEEERSTQYADWALGRLIEQAKKQDWYSNTVFVFLGDHGYSTPGTYEMPLSYHNTPFVLHKPNTLPADTLHNVGYQPDVTSTIAGLLGLTFTNTTFGIDLMKEKHPFVFFTADDKIGCVSEDGYFFYELMAQKTKRLRKYRDLDQSDYYNSNKSKADSLEVGAKSMLDAAEFFLRRDYFSY